MLSKSHPIILFIDRFGFSVYQDTLVGIPKFNFTPDLVANLDVINKEQFVTLIVTFMQINKIIPSSLAVILSDNVIFVKDLVAPVQKTVPTQGLKEDSGDDKDNKDEVQNFLEDIPFEEVLAKVIKIGNTNRVVAVNKDLVMAIVDAFTSNKSVVEAITPSFIFGQNANFTAGLTLNNARIVLEDIETLKLGNLLTDQEKIVFPQNLESKPESPLADIKPDLTNGAKTPQSLRQYILIGVFITLLIILAVVYLNLGVSQTPSKSSKAKNTSIDVISVPTLAPTSEPILTQTPIATSSVDLKTVKIKIMQSSEQNEIATGLKNAILDIGYQDIADEISEAATPEKSSISFSQNIPVDLRDNVITEVKKILPDISILENQNSDSTINISIGRS